MSKVKIQGNASGTGVLTITAPNTSTDRTITLPDATATIATTTDVAAKAPIASPEFTGIVKVTDANPRIRIMESDTTNVNTQIQNQGGDLIIGTLNDAADSATTRITLDHATGDVTLGTGDLIFGTAGKGIVLGSTTNVAANTLDDYEEGTWTPSINDGSPTYTTTYARTGVYTKIGNVVHIYMELYMGAISFGDATQTLVFSGLPFASRSTGDTFGMGMASSVTWSSIYTNGSTYNTGSMADASILQASPTILSNSSVFRISLSGKSNIGRSYLKNAAFHNGSGMAVGFTYHTA